MNNSVFLAFIFTLSLGANAEDSCPAINCDCAAFSDRRWLQACRLYETEIKRACAANANTPKNYCLVHGDSASPLPFVSRSVSWEKHRMLKPEKWTDRFNRLNNISDSAFEALLSAFDGMDYGDVFNRLKRVDELMDEQYAFHIHIDESFENQRLQNAGPPSDGEKRQSITNPPSTQSRGNKNLLDQYSASAGRVADDTPLPTTRRGTGKNSLDVYSSSSFSRANQRSVNRLGEDADNPILAKISARYGNPERQDTPSAHWQVFAARHDKRARRIHKLGVQTAAGMALAIGKDKIRLAVLAQKALRTAGKSFEQSADAYSRVLRVRDSAEAWLRSAEVAVYLSTLEQQMGETPTYSRILASARYARAAHYWFLLDERGDSVEALRAARPLVDNTTVRSLDALIRSIETDNIETNNIETNKMEINGTE